MKTIPYTTSTGVKIGLRWNESPKPMPIDDPDMILIQGWLIQSPEWHRSRRLERIIYGLSTAFALLIAIAMMVSK
jgi:hypothetical protein